MDDATSLQALEQQYLQEMLSHHFGYYLLLLGESDTQLVASSPVQNHFVVSPYDNLKAAGAVSQWQALPFAEGSVDVVVLSHAVEQTQKPQDLLAEAFRVLRHDGHLIISGYNPLRWRVNRLGRERYGSQWCQSGWLLGNMIRSLHQLGCEVVETQRYGFIAQDAIAIDKPTERVGRWFLPWLGLGYMLKAQKKTVKLMPVKPTWQEAGFLVKKPVGDCQAQKTR